MAVTTMARPHLVNTLMLNASKRFEVGRVDAPLYFAPMMQLKVRVERAVLTFPGVSMGDHPSISWAIEVAVALLRNGSVPQNALAFDCLTHLVLLVVDLARRRGLGP